MIGEMKTHTADPAHVQPFEVATSEALIHQRDTAQVRRIVRDPSSIARSSVPCAND
jgi:hypothetical protein